VPTARRPALRPHRSRAPPPGCCRPTSSPRDQGERPTGTPSPAIALIHPDGEERCRGGHPLHAGMSRDRRQAAPRMRRRRSSIRWACRYGRRDDWSRRRGGDRGGREGGCCSTRSRPSGSPWGVLEQEAQGQSAARATPIAAPSRRPGSGGEPVTVRHNAHHPSPPPRPGHPVRAPGCKRLAQPRRAGAEQPVGTPRRRRRMSRVRQRLQCANQDSRGKPTPR